MAFYNLLIVFKSSDTRIHACLQVHVYVHCTPLHPIIKQCCIGKDYIYIYIYMYIYIYIYMYNNLFIDLSRLLLCLGSLPIVCYHYDYI